MAPNIQIVQCSKTVHGIPKMPCLHAIQTRYKRVHFFQNYTKEVIYNCFGLPTVPLCSAPGYCQSAVNGPPCALDDLYILRRKTLRVAT